MSGLVPELAVICPTPRETLALGAVLARASKPGDVLLLSGDLGAGKTTLTKGFVAELAPEVDVTSPTFALCHLYRSDPVVAHADCWRLETLGELADLAIDEVLDDGGVALIEWGERAIALFGRDALVVLLTTEVRSGELVRSAICRPASDRWGTRLAQLAEDCCSQGLAASIVEARDDLFPADPTRPGLAT